MELTAGAHDHGTLIRRYGIEGILDCWRSRYQECRRAGDGRQSDWPARPGISTSSCFSMSWSPTALIHLGEWRELQRETTAALELGEGKRQSSRPVRCVA